MADTKLDKKIWQKILHEEIKKVIAKNRQTIVENTAKRIEQLDATKEL